MTISLSTDNENVCTGMNRIITSLADIADTRFRKTGTERTAKTCLRGLSEENTFTCPQARSSRTGHNWFACVMFDMWVTL